MKKILAFALSTVLLALCLSGCVLFGGDTVGGGIVGKGDPESFEYTVGEFSEIRVELYCNIEYYAAPSDTVTLEIQPNLKEYIEVKESGGVLTVRSTKSINWTGKAAVLTVSTPTLSRLALEGASNFRTHDTIVADSFTLRMGGAGSGKIDLDVDKLSVAMSGAGGYELSGRADSAELEMSGAGNLDALALQTRETKIDLSGVGTVQVSCSENLRIAVAGEGSVEYRGFPNVDLQADGYVRVKKVN